MKITKAHAVSLGVNAVLIALAVFQWRARTSDAPPPVSTAAHSLSRSDESGISEAAPGVQVPPVQMGTGWQQWIGSLRSAKVPAEALASLIRADFDRRWSTREAEMHGKYMAGQADADALAVLALDHDTEFEGELRSALGADEFRRWDMGRVMQSLNPNEIQLSDSERDAVYELQRGLRDNLRNTQADKLRGHIDQATLNSREQSAQEAVAQQLRTLLGEQRAAQLQGSDETLGELRRGLSAVPLSDTKLKALADLQRSWDQTRSQLVELQNNTGDSAYAEAIRQAEEKWRGEFQQIAGADAFDKFLKSQDSRYADLRRFGASWQVPPADIERIFDVVGNYDDTVREYRLDAQSRETDWAATHAVLQQFQQETERSLQQRLGPKRYAELKQNGIVP